MTNFLLFHSNNGYTNAPQYYVYTYMVVIITVVMPAFVVG